MMVLYKYICTLVLIKICNFTNYYLCCR